jgi:hypothetical protein
LAILCRGFALFPRGSFTFACCIGLHSCLLSSSSVKV